MPAELPPIVPTDDFWSRQANTQTHSFTCAPYGHPANITSNDETALAAVRLSTRRYSAAPETGGERIRIQIVVRPEADASLPNNLTDRLAYSGVGEWITLSAGEWGHGFANLRSREACIVLTRSLAASVRIVSRYFIDHYVLNLILTDWAMLHASCVIDPSGEHLIVMVATHNTGKSTTALRLVRAGYLFLADGIVLLRAGAPAAKSDPTGVSLIAGGYPVGEVKLRDDVLAEFPEYAGESVQVREQQKTIIDLRAVHPQRVAGSLIRPASIHVCCVERSASPATQIDPIDASTAVPLLTGNTAYWNEAPALDHNTATLHHLLRAARWYRLRIGSDTAGLVAAVNRMIG